MPGDAPESGGAWLSHMEAPPGLRISSRAADGSVSDSAVPECIAASRIEALRGCAVDFTFHACARLGCVLRMGMQVADFRHGVLHSRCRRAIGAEPRRISFAPAFIGMRDRVRGGMPQKFSRQALHESRALCREDKKSVQIWNLDGFSQTIKKEAWVGIEPTHKAFAEPRLTTWLPRRKLKFHTKSEKNPPGKKNF